MAEGVQVTPAECGAENSSVRKRCKFSCPVGYRLLGSRVAKCRRDGVWKSNGGPPKCVAIPEETSAPITTAATPMKTTTTSQTTIIPRLTTIMPGKGKSKRTP